MVNIEIDGKKIEAQPGEMVIQAADRAGIYIPRFCYHHKLSIAANCRMCLVDVEKAPKTLPACATPVAEGMKIFTQSSKTKDSQKAVMEFLLINHPLDCPICDQGGQCELQDLAMGYGRDNSLYHETKRAVEHEDIGPLVATEMTRCIHCTRCVRFGQEVAGERELGATGRGENMRITTYIAKHLQSEFSGNVIDLCPVGALTSKPFRFKARAWELDQLATIAPHDCLGSNVYAQVWREKLMKVVPRENESINEVWLSDRDRFSYEGVNSEERVQQPWIKQNGQWQAVDWHTAFEFTVKKLQAVIKQYGAEQVGTLISPNATLEEMYLLQKITRELGSSNIDHRLRQTDFSDQQQFPVYPSLGLPLSELEHLSAFLLVGSNIIKEQPLVALRLRKATLRGAKALAVNMLNTPFNFALSSSIISEPNNFCHDLASVALALANNSGQSLTTEQQVLLQEVTITQQALDIAEQLRNSPKAAVMLGALASHHPQAATIRALAQLIAQLSGASFGMFTEGANSAGAWLADAVPHRQAGGKAVPKAGLDAHQMLAQPRKAYLLFGIEPQLDCTNPKQAKAALAMAEFNVMFSAFDNSSIREYADVILPIVPFSETSGTFVNVEGKWQTFKAVTLPLAEARPGWKVLRVLANMLDITGFDYIADEQVRLEVEQLVDKNAAIAAHYPLATKVHSRQSTTQWQCITELPMYATDSLVRRAPALQQTVPATIACAHVNSRMLQALAIQEGQQILLKQTNSKTMLPVVIDERVPDYCVLLNAGVTATAELELGFGQVELQVIEEQKHAY